MRDFLSLNPESDKDVSDGCSYYLRVYDGDDEIAGTVGGYMPTNKTMEKIRLLISNEIPKEQYQKIRDAQGR